MHVEHPFVPFAAELGGLIPVIQVCALWGLLAFDADVALVAYFVVRPFGHGAPFSHRKPACCP